VELRDLGARVHLFDEDCDDLGFAHVPGPVEPGDVVALADGSAWKVTDVVPFDDRTALDALCEVEPVEP
jgi:hypothetical protein